MDGVLVIFPGSFLARCVLCGRLIVQNSHLYGRNARHFLLTAFASAAYCAAGAQQKTTVGIDGTLANFSILLSDSLGTVRPFCCEKYDLHGRNSRYFFCRPLVACFCGSTIHRDLVTSCYDFSFKWFHFDVILEPFWVHFGVQNGLMDIF